MNPEKLTIAQILQESDYNTGMFGKWHLGDAREYRPAQRGFDEVWQNGAGGIGQLDDQPFFAYIAPKAPHGPLLENDAPKPWKQLFWLENQ